MADKTLEERIKEAALQEGKWCFCAQNKEGLDAFVNVIKQAIRDAGYVQLDADQTLPPIPRKDIIHIIAERDRVLLAAGFKKVKSC